MLTFGGRPLNTYKGGAGNVQPEKPLDKSAETNKQVIQSPSINEPKPIKSIETTNEPKPIKSIETTNEIKSIEPPSTQPIQSPIQDKPSISNNNPRLTELTGKKVITPQEKYKKDDETRQQLKDAQIGNSLLAQALGPEVAFFASGVARVARAIYNTIVEFKNLIVLLIMLIVFIFILNTITQILEVYHKILDEVKKILTAVNDVAIDFTVPGIRIPEFGIDTGDLLKVYFKLFGDMFADPINKVQEQINATPWTGLEVLINLIVKIIEDLPKFLDHIIDVFTKMADTIK